MFSFYSSSAWLDKKKYEELYRQSIDHPELFWGDHAHSFLSWFKPWEKVYQGSFAEGDNRWFEGGELNACFNCLDRHLEKRSLQTALIWQGEEENQVRSFNYQEVYEAVCRLANGLKKLNVLKGDRICIYMPMIPEAVFAVLACARIGAIHSVVFGGFSSASLSERIKDADCKIVITADHAVRGGKNIPLKANVDDAIAGLNRVRHVLVVNHRGLPVAWKEKRDIWYSELLKDISVNCPPSPMRAEDPLFILYTSGSTGKPKGLLHSTAGYLLYTAVTYRYVFDYKEKDIYWCTADIGWITGHSYLIYGPFLNGATTLMFEGIPTYPNPSRNWDIIDKFKVNQFYTAPTALRSLMSAGETWLKTSSRNSLRILGSVGEPINPEVWNWYFESVGRKKCPIVDTWWQTETGGHMITPLPYVSQLKAGKVNQAFLGILPVILDEQGKPLDQGKEGRLAIARSWPGIARTIYGDHQRYLDTYFKVYPGFYFSGDGARCDSEGDYEITGRIDDMIKVSGHLLGTAEIESALILNQDVAEAAVVGYPHPIKGQGIYAFVSLIKEVKPSPHLKKELIELVRQQIGPIATLDIIQWAPGLPKTRSGKIMRRILRKIAAGETENLGDISTLSNPEIVQKLMDHCD